MRNRSWWWSLVLVGVGCGTKGEVQGTIAGDSWGDDGRAAASRTPGDARAAEAPTPEEPAPAELPPGPSLSRTVVTRVGPRGRYLRARFHWEPVAGASSYRLQISRSDDFSEPVVDVTSDEPQASCKGVPARRVFVRVSAQVGGQWGEFGEARALRLKRQARGWLRRQGLEEGDQTIAATRQLPMGAADGEEGRASPRPPAEPAVTFTWEYPADRADLDRGNIKLRGVAPRGSHIRVAGAKPVRVGKEQTFSIPVKLQSGENTLELAVRLRGEVTRHRRTVTWAHHEDAEPVEGNTGDTETPAGDAARESKTADLRARLAELSAIHNELVETLEATQGVIATLRGASKQQAEQQAVEMQREIVSLGQAVRQLEAELERTSGNRGQ